MLFRSGSEIAVNARPSRPSVLYPSCSANSVFDLNPPDGLRKLFHLAHDRAGYPFGFKFLFARRFRRIAGHRGKNLWNRNGIDQFAIQPDLPKALTAVCEEKEEAGVNWLLTRDDNRMKYPDSAGLCHDHTGHCGDLLPLGENKSSLAAAAGWMNRCSGVQSPNTTIAASLAGTGTDVCVG